MDASEIPTNALAFEKLARSREGRTHVTGGGYGVDGLYREPSTEPGLEIDRPPSRSRFLYLTRISGEPEKVLDEVAYRLKRDTCTPMYEHMLLQVGAVEIVDAATIRVVLSKNSYAGD